MASNRLDRYRQSQASSVSYPNPKPDLRNDAPDFSRYDVDLMKLNPGENLNTDEGTFLRNSKGGAFLFLPKGSNQWQNLSEKSLGRARPINVAPKGSDVLAKNKDGRDYFGNKATGVPYYRSGVGKGVDVFNPTTNAFGPASYNFDYRSGDAPLSPEFGGNDYSSGGPMTTLAQDAANMNGVTPADTGPQTPRLDAGPQTPNLNGGPQTPRLDAGPQTPNLNGGPQTPRLDRLGAMQGKPLGNLATSMDAPSAATQQYNRKKEAYGQFYRNLSRASRRGDLSAGRALLDLFDRAQGQGMQLGGITQSGERRAGAAGYEQAIGQGASAIENAANQASIQPDIPPATAAAPSPAPMFEWFTGQGGQRGPFTNYEQQRPAFGGVDARLGFQPTNGMMPRNPLVPQYNWY